MTDGKSQRPEELAEAPLGRSEPGAMEEAREIVNFNPPHDGDFDDEWAEKAQRVARALLSSPRVEEVRREALEEAAAECEATARRFPSYAYAARKCAATIRALSLQVEGTKP